MDVNARQDSWYTRGQASTIFYALESKAVLVDELTDKDVQGFSHGCPVERLWTCMNAFHVLLETRSCSCFD